MGQVLEFRRATKEDLPTIDEKDRDIVMDFVGDLFKAHMTCLLMPEMEVDYKDRDMIEYLYEKYSDRFEELYRC